VPTVILALIAAFSQTSWSAIKYTRSMPKAGDPDVIEMEVVGQQFAWNFHYPGKDGKLGRCLVTLRKPKGTPDEVIGLDRTDEAAKDDYVLTQMVIPVHRNINVRLTSIDVIHSFFLPNFRIKQDAVPGMNSKVWLQAEKTSGEVIGRNPDDFPLKVPTATGVQLKPISDNKPFDIACAELCGQGHFKMRGTLWVVNAEEYNEFTKTNDENVAAQNSAGEGY
jgi:cytochrome c oxidase subunit 2